MKVINGRPIVAAFDFDGTLTYRDTLLPFLNYIGSPARTYFSIFLALPRLILAPFIPDIRQSVKESVLKHILGGTPIGIVRQQGDIFANEKIKGLLNPEGMQRLVWHKQQGHRCVLISATLDVYLEPWALASGFHDLICTKLDTDAQGHVTGKIVGKNCWGEEKKRRILKLLGPKEGFTLYAYGDSRGDKELLDLADYAFYRRFT